MVCTLHIVAFYQKVIKGHILIEKVSLNFNSFYGWCCWHHSLLGFDTISVCKWNRPYTKHSACTVEVEGIGPKKGWCQPTQQHVVIRTQKGVPFLRTHWAVHTGKITGRWHIVGHQAAGQRQGIVLCSPHDSLHTTGSLNKGRCSTLFVTGIEHRPVVLKFEKICSGVAEV